jgi:2-methylcitrate dehydratase PrpD
MALLGATTVVDMVGKGWHASKILGTFGAAAAAGKLLGLTSQELTHAFGIAGSDAAGTMEYERSGGEVKRMHSGSAARTGTQAALLAKDGLTGPPTIIEGERGVLRLITGRQDLCAPDELWEHFHIIDTTFRMYPTIGSAGPAIDAVRNLQRQYELQWRDITEIRLGLPEIAIGHGASVTRPTDAVSAQFSTAFSIALRLVRGQNRPADYFDPALWVDPDLLSVVDKITPHPQTFPPDAPLLSCQIDIALKDGRVLTDTRAGRHPNEPDTSDHDIGAKFRDNVDGTISAAAARAIIEQVQALDQAKNLIGLMGHTATRISAPVPPPI